MISRFDEVVQVGIKLKDGSWVIGPYSFITEEGEFPEEILFPGQYNIPIEATFWKFSRSGILLYRE